MKCVLLVAGHDSVLQDEIRADETGNYAHLEGVPKALMPGVGGKRLLDYWWDIIKNRQLFSEVFLVTNADKFKHFERWASASEFPATNVLNDGTSSHESRLGSVADLALCLRARGLGHEDVCVIAGDMMFQGKLKVLLAERTYTCVLKPDRIQYGDTAIYYELDPVESISSRGIVEICQFTNKIVRFYEKPKENETTSRNASVVFYCFRESTLPSIEKYLTLFPRVSERSMGQLLRWLINEQECTFYGLKLPTGFQMIGQTNLRSYEEWLKYFGAHSQDKVSKKKVTKRAYARIGLVGNPSDGFFGKTISLSIRNFWAEVSISESAKLVLTPHPLCDPTEFGSLADLHGISSKEGYLGGLRLLQATCKKFFHYCSRKGIALAKRNFTIKYDTNVPRQVGLAGSSAIVTATLKCLMSFFQLNESDLPKELQPQFILEVEVAELRINAGLQDRVVQVYEGLVSMDFSKEIMDKQGYGDYENISIKAEEFPLFFLCYLSDPSDSGRIHSTVRQRFDSGDEVVVAGMKRFAALTTEAMEALSARDWTHFASLMDENFQLRRSLYGNDCIGQTNLRMAELGKKYGAACKFPGSGGAIVGLLPDSSTFEEMKKDYENEGFVVTKVIPNIK